MLVRLLCRTKGTTLWLIFLLFIFSCFSKAWSLDLGDQTAIIEAYFRANSKDRALAQSLAEQARERAPVDSDSPITDFGPLVKLWCEAAAIAPNPENLGECARFRFAAVNQMSNPQPSKKVVQMQRARESLVMVRAALEIAGGDPSISDALRLRLKNDVECLRSFISGESTSKNCNWYRY